MCAGGVLNYAALIASDLGMTDLATDLCWRQHRAFTQAVPLSGDIAVMALMPLVNISRLLTREGDGAGAYDVLVQLYQAAQLRSVVRIRGNDVDMSAFISTELDHRKVCEELWVALLVDGARALARTGRWTDSAKAMAAHRGIGSRLLDGRQILIMSLMEKGLDQQAGEVIESSTLTEPWEKAVAALLRVCCRTEPSSTHNRELEAALRETNAVVVSPEPSTAVFQTRVGLVSLEIAKTSTGLCTADLRKAIVDAAALDASAAREVLKHPVASIHLSADQIQRFETILSDSGIGIRHIPQEYIQNFTDAVNAAEASLENLLRADPKTKLRVN